MDDREENIFRRMLEDPSQLRDLRSGDSSPVDDQLSSGLDSLSEGLAGISTPPDSVRRRRYLVPLALATGALALTLLATTVRDTSAERFEGPSGESFGDPQTQLDSDLGGGMGFDGSGMYHDPRPMILVPEAVPQDDVGSGGGSF